MRSIWTVKYLMLHRLTHQRSAEPILRAAGSEARTPPSPLDIVSSEGRSSTAPLPLPRPQQPTPHHPDTGHETQHCSGHKHAHSCSLLATVSCSCFTHPETKHEFNHCQQSLPSKCFPLPWNAFGK